MKWFLAAGCETRMLQQNTPAVSWNSGDHWPMHTGSSWRKVWNICFECFLTAINSFNRWSEIINRWMFFWFIYPARKCWSSDNRVSPFHVVFSRSTVKQLLSDDFFMPEELIGIRVEIKNRDADLSDINSEVTYLISMIWWLMVGVRCT